MGTGDDSSLVRFGVAALIAHAILLGCAPSLDGEGSRVAPADDIPLAWFELTSGEPAGQPGNIGPEPVQVTPQKKRTQKAQARVRLPTAVAPKPRRRVAKAQPLAGVLPVQPAVEGLVPAGDLADLADQVSEPRGLTGREVATAGAVGQAHEGAVVDGSAGGSVAGGSVAGGSVAGGSVAGGSVAGGSVVGGSVAGGVGRGAPASRPRLLAHADPCRGFFPSAATTARGRVQIAVDVDPEGRAQARQVILEHPSGQGFGAAASACVATLAFVPAKDQAGAAIAGLAKLQLDFRL